MFSSHQLYLYVNPWIAIFQVFLMKVGVEQFELTKINFLLYLNEVQCKRFFAKAWLFKFMVFRAKSPKSLKHVIFVYLEMCLFDIFDLGPCYSPDYWDSLKISESKNWPEARVVRTVKQDPTDRQVRTIRLHLDTVPLRLPDIRFNLQIFKIGVQNMYAQYLPSRYVHYCWNIQGSSSHPYSRYFYLLISPYLIYTRPSIQLHNKFAQQNQSIYPINDKLVRFPTNLKEPRSNKQIKSCNSPTTKYLSGMQGRLLDTKEKVMDSKAVPYYDVMLSD